MGNDRRSSAGDRVSEVLDYLKTHKRCSLRLSICVCRQTKTILVVTYITVVFGVVLSAVEPRIRYQSRDLAASPVALPGGAANTSWAFQAHLSFMELYFGAEVHQVASISPGHITANVNADVRLFAASSSSPSELTDEHLITQDQRSLAIECHAFQCVGNFDLLSEWRYMYTQRKPHDNFVVVVR